MSAKDQVSYEFGDIELLKRTLLSGKKATFTDIGTFYLEEDSTFTPPLYYIKFKADSDLKNIVWEVLYYGVDRKAKECTDIANHLISMNTIDLVGFGKIYIYFEPGYFTWHDFHGETWVDPKPRIKFLKHENFKIFNENSEKNHRKQGGTLSAKGFYLIFSLNPIKKKNHRADSALPAPKAPQSYSIKV